MCGWLQALMLGAIVINHQNCMIKLFFINQFTALK